MKVLFSLPTSRGLLNLPHQPQRLRRCALRPFASMSRNTYNDVPPDILDDEEDDDLATTEAGSDIELDLEVNPGAVERGNRDHQAFLVDAPQCSGVYRMLDARNDVLYVGKAKSLKSRVGSYARGQAIRTGSPG